MTYSTATKARTWAKAAKSMPWPGTTFVMLASMSATLPWPDARRAATACSWVMPAGICLPTTPSKMMFVAFPRILGETIANRTLTTAKTMTRATSQRSGRSSPSRRPNDCRKFFDFAAGIAAKPIGPPPPGPPGPRRIGGRPPGAPWPMPGPLTRPPPR